MQSSTTNYGTIPITIVTNSPSSSTLQPWKNLLDLNSFSKPYSYPETLTRIRTNLYNFRYNYSLILLIILFLTLIYHPYSMLTFLVIFVLWVVLYFFRDAPVVVFGKVVDDRVVFGLLGSVTVVGLVFTGVGLNVLVGLAVGVFVIGLHSSFRVLEDEDDLGDGALRSFVGGISSGYQTISSALNHG